MGHSVTCKYCKQKFDRDKQPFVVVGTKRYAHAECAQNATENQGKELKILDPANTVICRYCGKDLPHSEAIVITTGCFAHKDCITDLTDSEKLDQYIMKLYEVDHVPAYIKKQIKDYVRDYHFTHSGIERTLKYFYEIKKQPFNKSRETIGIVPYVYKQAYNYYYTIWLAKEANKDVVIEKPEVVEIKIQKPQRQNKKTNKQFSFLEEVDE